MVLFNTDILSSFTDAGGHTTCVYIQDTHIRPFTCHLHLIAR